MLKQILLLAYSLVITISAFSQQKSPVVIAPAGDVSKTNTISLEWTLGEPFVETLTSKFQMITQGFHQPLVRTKKPAAVVTTNKEQFTITILPNPVLDICRTYIARTTNTILYLELTDIQGRLLYNTRSNSKVEVIEFDFTSFTSGTYILTARDAKGDLYKSYKIIKAQ